MKKISIASLNLLLIVSICCSKAKTEVTTLEPSGFERKKISDNLYVLKAPNYNTNTGVFIGDDGLLLVDPMPGTDNEKALLNEIGSISDKPIKYVVNTHSHDDHSGANQMFLDMGASVVSHENAKYSNAATDITFQDEYTIDMGNETVQLIHIKAHTIDDALVYLPTSNAVFMGDTYMTNSYPHYYYGGGGKGHLAILDKALGLSNNETAIIPAHGELVSSKAKLKEYRSNSESWITKMKEHYNKGQSVEQIALDVEIQKLSKYFTQSSSINESRLIRTIGKSISCDFVQGITLSEDELNTYKGKYVYDNGKIDEIVSLDGSLYLRTDGFMFGLLPLAPTKFLVKGRSLDSYIDFDKQKNTAAINGRSTKRVK